MFLFHRYSCLVSFILLLSTGAFGQNAFGGGVSDGFSNAQRTNSNCSVSAALNPYGGGSDAGLAHALKITSACAVSPVLTIFGGGSDDAFSNSRRLNATCEVAPELSVFTGGTGDGFTNTTLINTACSVEPVLTAFSGGINDGFANRQRIYSNCFGESTTIIDVNPKTVCEGDSIILTGTLFTNVNLVEFNGANADVFSIIDSSLILAIVPVGANSGPVSVSGPDGTATTLFELAISPLPVAAFTVEQLGGLVADFTNSSSNANTYLWDFGDGNTSVEENPSFTFLASDVVYPVTLVTTNNCGSDTFTTNVNFTTVWVLTPEQTELTLMPNPFRDNLNIRIKLPREEMVHVHVFNMVGQLVYQSSFIAGNETYKSLDLTDLPAGIYSVSFESGRVGITRKVIKYQGNF